MAVYATKVAVNTSKQQNAAFYGDLSDQNPVLLAFEQELQGFLISFKQKNQAKSAKCSSETQSRRSLGLFKIWNNYESRLPADLFSNRLLDIGDLLLKHKQYGMAYSLCYSRYLNQYSNLPFAKTINDINAARQLLFPEGHSGSIAKLTLRALLGEAISRFHLAVGQDPQILSSWSISETLQALQSLRLTTQIMLSKESLCWLVYNGTIHIYTVCRSMMHYGHSAVVIEYLLWACMCLESSLPLLSTKYLPWRSTLYVAVCQCYFDVKQSHSAELFAKRGINKINELFQLEKMSALGVTSAIDQTFKRALLKMNLMVFRRTCIESRRKSKGTLRPRLKQNLADVKNQAWPRTLTERQLNDMFVGSAAHFLAILEALQYISHRRILQSGSVTLDADEYDVYNELFFAGIEILTNNSISIKERDLANLNIIDQSETKHNVASQLSLAVQGINGVTLTTATKFIKAAFAFEQWEIFNTLVGPILYLLKGRNTSRCLADYKILQLMLSYRNVCLHQVSNVKVDNVTNQEGVVNVETNNEQENKQDYSVNGNHSTRHCYMLDDLLRFADVVESCLEDPFKPALDTEDPDVLVEAALLMKSHCKSHFNRIVSSTYDNCRHVITDESFTKWIRLLEVTSRIMNVSNATVIDPAIGGEVALRLALLIECVSDVASQCVTIGDQVFASSAKNSERSTVDCRTAYSTMSGALRIASSTVPTTTATAVKSVGRDLSNENRAELENLVATSNLTVPGRPEGNVIDGFDKYESNVQFGDSIIRDGTKATVNVSEMVTNEGGREYQNETTNLLGDVPSYSLNFNYTSAYCCLLKARDVLESVLQEMNNAMDTHVNITSVVDHKNSATQSKVQQNGVKKNTTKNLKASSQGRNHSYDNNNANKCVIQHELVLALQVEISFVLLRILLKLSKMSPDASKPKRARNGRGCHRAFTSQIEESIRTHDSEEMIRNKYSKNYFTEALFLMQKVGLEHKNSVEVSENERRALERSYELLSQAQQNERAVLANNSQVKNHEHKIIDATIPSAPVLIHRSGQTMVFKVAPYAASDGSKVAYYCLFGRNASGSNVKARLGDNQIRGTGILMPASTCEHGIRVTDLAPNERYVFAFAAYNSDGLLIGNNVGVSTRPIIASSPLPVMVGYALLCQVAYQVGAYPVAKSCAAILWDTFVEDPPNKSSQFEVERISEEVIVRIRRLINAKVKGCSDTLLRQFFQSIFIDSDCHIREKSSYCNTLCDNGPLYPGQYARIRECEHMIIAFEIAGWLNDPMLMIQVLVQCYGLLAPFIQLQVPSFAVIRILLRCHCVMHELPSTIFQRRNPTTTDALHRMVASIDFFVALCLRVTRQKKLADSIHEATKKLLSIDTAPETQSLAVDNEQSTTPTGTEAANIVTAAVQPSENRSCMPVPKTTEAKAISGAGTASHAQTNKTKKKKRKQRGGKDRENDIHGNPTVNDELKALEAHMVMVHVSNAKAPHVREELTGIEDDSVLFAYIQNVPATFANKELNKFRRRARFLEFFVQVVIKASQEGHAELALEWSSETFQWLKKRNEQIIKNTNIPLKPMGADDQGKKYGAALVEYINPQQQSFKQQDATVTQKYLRARGLDDKPSSPYARNDYHGRTAVRPSHLRRHERNSGKGKDKRERDEDEMAAIQILKNVLPEYWRLTCRRRRLRQVCMEEMAWLGQLYVQLGICSFITLINKLNIWQKSLGTVGYDPTRVINAIDQDWLSLMNIGKVLLEWDGSPRRWCIGKEDNKIKLPDEIDRNDKNVDDRPATVAVTGTSQDHNSNSPSSRKDDNFTEAVSSAPAGKKAQRGQKLIDESENDQNVKNCLELIKKTFEYFAKASIIAHRGRHWILLQNAARCTWNCVGIIYQYCLAYVIDENKDTVESSTSAVPLYFDSVRTLVWSTFYRISDNILDMIEQIQAEEKEIIGKRAKVASTSDHLTGYVGELNDEKGGSSLFFESPLDDVTKIDMRFVTKLILASLEQIYLEGRWEHLTNLCMRFGNLTNDRYANIVIPLQIVGQRKIAARIIANGGQLPESYSTELNKKFGVRRQNTDSAIMEHSTIATRSSNATYELANVYRNNTDSLKVTCISLDISKSLLSFHKYLDSVHYTARSLQQSRQLLLRYLAGRIGSRDGYGTPDSAGSRKSFVAIEKVIDIPHDAYGETFNSMSSLHCAPLNVSQLNTVVSAYQKTIELLQNQKDDDLIVQAMQELGNLMFHAGDIRMALKWWSGSLDTLLKMPEALLNWRSIFKNNAKSRYHYIALDKYGIWGCIKGGIISANIAQFMHSTNLGVRLECCLLAATLFKGLFATSLPHPSADCDYAFYEIGDHVSPELLSGVDLFSDCFRCDGSSLLGALRYTSYELLRSNYKLKVLPILTLYQYLATYVCRDAKASVEARILKILALADLGCFMEALLVLGQTLNGDKIPKIEDNRFRQPESSGNLHRFNTTRLITDEKNYKVIVQLLEKPVPPGLSAIYGQFLTNKLRIAQAHLALAIARSITIIPSQHIPSSDIDLFASGGRESKLKLRRQSTIFKQAIASATRNIHSILMRKLDEVFQKGPASKARTSNISTKAPKATTEGKQGPIPKTPTIQSNLIKGAEKILQQVSEEVLDQAKQNMKNEMNVDNIESNLVLNNLCSADLETISLVYIEFADIASQRHQTLVSAQLAFDCMKLLQESSVLSGEEHARSQVYSSLSSRIYTNPNRIHSNLEDYFRLSQLDMRLWLKCRLVLATALNELGSSCGKSSANLRFGDCKYHIEEGITEAQAFNDHEFAVQFAIQGIIFDLKQGKDSKLIHQELEDVTKLVESLPDRSTDTQLLHALALMQQTDLLSMQKDYYTLNNLKKCFKHYQVVHDMLINQIMQLGIPILRHKDAPHLSSPMPPLANIYLSHSLHLVQAKLRLGHVMAQIAAVEATEKGLQNPPYQAWLPVASILTTALRLLRASTHRAPNMEAELLLSLGQVQRQLCNVNKIDGRLAVSTLVDAIRTSFATSHDHALIRQAYLEVALIYIKSMNEEATIQEMSESPDQATAPVNTSTITTMSESNEQLIERQAAEPDKLPSQLQPLQQKELHRYGGRIRGKGKLTREQLREASLLHQISAKAQAETSENRAKQQKKESEKHTKEIQEQKKAFKKNIETCAAWTAIRAASLSAQARHCLHSLSSSTGAWSSLRISLEAYMTIPDFALLDLLGSKVLNCDYLYDNESNNLTWSQILSYYLGLQRECFNASTVTVAEPQNIPADSELGVQEELGVDIDDSHLNYIGEQLRVKVSVIRTPVFFNKSANKVASMHAFLLNVLPQYKQDCCSVHPPDALDLQPIDASSISIIPYIEYNNAGSTSHGKENKPTVIAGSPVKPSISLSTPARPESIEPKRVTAGSIVAATSTISGENNVSVAKENEICCQWYRPPLQRIIAQPKRNQYDKKTLIDKPCIILLYAFNTKSTEASDPMQTAKSISCGQIILPYSDIMTIHNSLIELKHAAKSILVSKAPKLPEQQGSPSRRRRSLKQLTGVITNDENVKEQLRECQVDITQLFKAYTDVSESVITNDIDISNVSSLENLFNPNRGNIHVGTDLFTWLSSLLNYKP